jgi:gamma-glutamyl phosphate reductase
MSRSRWSTSTVRRTIERFVEKRPDGEIKARGMTATSEERVPGVVELVIDEAAIAVRLGAKALRSKSGKATALRGALVVRRVGPRVVDVVREGVERVYRGGVEEETR